MCDITMSSKHQCRRYEWDSMGTYRIVLSYWKWQGFDTRQPTSSPTQLWQSGLAKDNHPFTDCFPVMPTVSQPPDIPTNPNNGAMYWIYLPFGHLMLENTMFSWANRRTQCGVHVKLSTYRRPFQNTNYIPAIYCILTIPPFYLHL